MVFAADYPFLDVFWTMIIFFCWVIWIWMLVVILSDLFRRHDKSGWGKALWVVFLIVLPFLGVLVYLIVRGNSMQERALQDAANRESQFRGYVQSVATTGGGAADELAKLADLRDKGVISDAEFQAAKAKALT